MKPCLAATLAVLVVACASAPPGPPNSNSDQGAPQAVMVLDATDRHGLIVPNWTFNGNDPAHGTLVLRCENAFPPEDHSGTCRCESYGLNPCADGVRSLFIDRKQCGFVCRPTAKDQKGIALRCPDATNPAASADGCACSGRKPMNPCAGPMASATASSGVCEVTCANPQ